MNELLAPDVQMMNEDDYATAVTERKTSLGELLGAQLGEGFAYTMLQPIMAKKREDYARTWVDRPDSPAVGFRRYLYRQQTGLTFYPGISEPEDRPLSEDEWRASPWFREGMKYDPKLTRRVAQIRAEEHVRTVYRQSLIARSPGGVFRGALGFAAGMLGSLPDPINFVPLAGPASKIPKIAAAVARRPVVTRALLGAAENVAATAVVQPLVFSRQAELGLDPTWEDSAWDLMLSGAIGALFGAGAGLVARRRGVAAQAHIKAVDDHLGGDPVDVGPVLRGVVQMPLGRVNAEVWSRFEPVDGAKTVLLDDLIGREDAKPLQPADAGEAVLVESMPPLRAVDLGDGSLRVLDGNKRLAALRAEGAEGASVLVVDLYQPRGARHVGQLLIEATEAADDLARAMKKLTGRLGGKLLGHPRVKTMGSAREKMARRGIGPEGITDYAAGTIVAENMGQVRAYQEALANHPWRTSLVDDRFTSPAMDGYRDLSVNFLTPAGHVVELQVNLPQVMAFKETVGHKIYEVTRKIDEVLDRAPANLRGRLNALQTELMGLARKGYDAAIMAADLALSADSFKAVVSEIRRDLDLILVRESGSEISTLLPSWIKKIRPSDAQTYGKPPSSMNLSDSDMAFSPHEYRLGRNWSVVKPATTLSDELDFRTLPLEEVPMPKAPDLEAMRRTPNLEDNLAEMGVDPDGNSFNFEVVEDLKTTDQLESVQIEDASGNRVWLDEAEEWDTANRAVEEAEKRSEAWKAAAQCLTVKGE